MACHGYDSDLGWPPLPPREESEVRTLFLQYLFLEYSGGGEGDHIKAHVRIVYLSILRLAVNVVRYFAYIYIIYTYVKKIQKQSTTYHSW